MQCDLCFRPITPCDAGQSTDHTVICGPCMDHIEEHMSAIRKTLFFAGATLGEDRTTDLPKPDVTVVG